MSCLSLAIYNLSIAFGLFSAVLWWMSARVGLKRVSSLSEADARDGEFAYQIGDGELFVTQHSRQSQLNAYAALCTGIAVAMPAVQAIVEKL